MDGESESRVTHQVAVDAALALEVAAEVLASGVELVAQVSGREAVERVLLLRRRRWWLLVLLRCGRRSGLGSRCALLLLLGSLCFRHLLPCLAADFAHSGLRLSAPRLRSPRA